MTDMTINCGCFTTLPFQLRCSKTHQLADSEPTPTGGKTVFLQDYDKNETDRVISTFTMLFQNESAGLEFGDRKTGEFMSAIPTEGVLYINIGDMLQRISNG
jgi:hypothetical protein